MLVPRGPSPRGQWWWWPCLARVSFVVHAGVSAFFPKRLQVFGFNIENQVLGPSLSLLIPCHHFPSSWKQCVNLGNPVHVQVQRADDVLELATLFTPESEQTDIFSSQEGDKACYGVIHRLVPPASAPAAFAVTATTRVVPGWGRRVRTT